MTRVLLAEDDTSISEPLSRALRREGYEVDVTADGPTTLDRALGEGVDLILLDIGLPELDGLEVCRRVRAGGYAVPVLILTARADEVDTVVGLDAGADDYVTKPFRLAELLARVRALLRRGTADNAVVMGLRIDPEARRAWHRDTELELTTFDRYQAFWVPRGWAQKAPILTQSRIDVPLSGATVQAGHVAVADTLDWPALARSGHTVVFYMAMAQLAGLTERLQKAGAPSDRAVAPPPAKEPLGPVAGAVNVTGVPTTGFPPDVTLAIKGLGNAVFMAALCGVPPVATALDGGPVVFVRLKLPGFATPVTRAVTV